MSLTGALVKGVYGALVRASDPAAVEEPAVRPSEPPAPVTDSSVPDAWWDDLSPARKAAVHRWLATHPCGPPAQHPGQVDLLDLVGGQ